MKNSSKNPNTLLKKKLAARFLRSMKKLTSKVPSSASMAEKGRRYHAIRAAAYASMASAVGPRKAWSRALLSKMRSHKVMMRGRKRVMSARRNPRYGMTTEHDALNELSEMVPGGKAMDSCRLLNETAHYINCLAAQVQIMREILHSSSSRLI